MAIPSISQSGDIFKLVKEIPFPEVVRAFYGEISRNNKISCPFHNEKDASFHVYPDAGHCYGCSWHGDGVAFVGELLGLQPLDAAKAIADRFGVQVSSKPLTRHERLKLARAKAERELEKKLQEGFDRWVRDKTYDVRGLSEAIRSVAEEQGVNTPLLDYLALFEHWADVLTMGTDKEKLALYRDAGFRRWFGWR